MVYMHLIEPWKLRVMGTKIDGHLMFKLIFNSTFSILRDIPNPTNGLTSVDPHIKLKQCVP